MLIGKTMLAGWLLLAAGFAHAQAAREPAPVDQEKAALIGELLDVTGALALSDQMMSRLLEAQKAEHPE